MNFSRKNIELSILIFTITVIALWQIIFILNLPDGDTDAYAHFIIARDIVRNPFNMGLHWVWLPLFHYIGALFVLFDSDMQSIRFMNIIIWNVTPLILYYHLKKKESDSIIPVTAALFTALSPIGILMGTTAQPEPLFALLILLFIITLEDGKYLSSALLLSLACMLRYEAWAVLLGLGIYILINIIKYKTLKLLIFGKSYKVYTVIILPLIIILIWSVIRYQSDNQWFSFLHGTQKFASDALGQSNSIDGGIWVFLKDLFLYPFWIPFLFTGITVLFVPFGFKKFYTKNVLFLVVGLSILIFISSSWVMKANLGLNRHFTSIVPFYSVMTAYGLYTVKDYMKKYSLFKSGKIILMLVATIALIYSIMWLNIWYDTNEESFKERKVAAAFLNRLYDSESGKGIMIISNNPVIEVFSKIDYKVFNHFWMDENQETTDYILYLKKTNKIFYIIANTKLAPFLKKFGVIIFESSQDTKNPDRIIILKI